MPRELCYPSRKAATNSVRMSGTAKLDLRSLRGGARGEKTVRRADEPVSERPVPPAETEVSEGAYPRNRDTECHFVGCPDFEGCDDMKAPNRLLWPYDPARERRAARRGIRRKTNEPNLVDS